MTNDTMTAITLGLVAAVWLILSFGPPLQVECLPPEPPAQGDTW